MAKISVLSITTRDLLLDVQANALANQEFKDFEWVLVDDAYEKNKEAVKNYVKGRFAVKHMPQRIQSDYYSASMALNTGLIHAEGELVYFMIDYVEPDTKCLKEHWDAYQKYPLFFFSGLRTLKHRTEGKLYGDIEDDRWMGISNGEYQCVEIEPSIYLLGKQLAPGWWAGRNDSAPLKVLIDCNGFEETLDGTRQDVDTNMAERMINYGLRYIYLRNCVCAEYDHSSVEKLHKGETSYKGELRKRINTEKLFRSFTKIDLNRQRQNVLGRLS